MVFLVHVSKYVLEYVPLVPGTHLHTYVSRHTFVFLSSPYTILET
jgi:hypothetical protein